MKKMLIGLGLLLVQPMVSAAEFEACNSLLHHGITNVTKQMGARHAVAYKWHSNCGQDFSSASDSSIKQASISVFGYGDGGTGSNTATQRERLKTWCDKNSDYSESSQELFEEARSISQPALEAWNQCQNFAKKGINITPSIQGEFDDFVHLTIDSESDGTHTFYGLTEVGYACDIRMKDGSDLASNRINQGTGKYLVMAKSPQILINNSNIHISCQRTAPTVVEAEGVGELTYSQGHISVMTSGPALPITIPKVVEAYSVTPPKSIMAFSSEQCPKGWKTFERLAGRFVVGTGQGTNLTDRELFDQGGSESITLSEANMPSHSHKALYGVQPQHADYGQGAINQVIAGVQVINHPETRSSVAGGSQAFDVMPPYLALLYCEKM